MKNKRMIYLGLTYFCLIVAMLSIVLIVWGNV